MAPQVPRLILAFATLVVGFLAFRSQVVPDSFGETGFYRADAVKEIGDLPMKHAGEETCATCHSDFAEATSHVLGGVACESCHGPSLAHAEDGASSKPNRLGGDVPCARCHEEIAGRPSVIPQIVLEEHTGGEPCQSCHTVHEP